MKKRVGSKIVPAKRPLPSALVKRAEKLARGKRARLLAEAKELLDLIRQKRGEIADAFYDVGLALRRLKDHDLLAALGHRTFDELCKTRLEMSATVAERLVQVVTTVPRKQAITMGQTKAAAMVTLAQATGEADTPAGLLRKGKLQLPGGGTLDTREASAKSIERAAKAIRQARNAASPRRGRTTTQRERDLAQKLEAALRRAGLARATVTAVATKPGETSELRIEHVPADGLGALERAVARVAQLKPGV